MNYLLSKRPVLMGIMNVNPDSFFPPSRAQSEAEMKARMKDLLERNCTILDIGAVSTRPGAPDVPPEEEWRRLEPALRLAHEKRLSLNAGFYQISIDTFRSEIVRKAYALIGPFIVNDISAGEDDEAMLETVAELGLPYIAMHKRGNPRSMDTFIDYPQGVVAAVLEYFDEFSRKAAAMGIKDWIVDPGFGFAKTSEQNWELLGEMKQFKRFGRPLLIGVADKRFTKDPLYNKGDLGLAEKLAWDDADILRIH
jgi:dihydropteroate synthase